MLSLLWKNVLSNVAVRHFARKHSRTTTSANTPPEEPVSETASKEKAVVKRGKPKKKRQKESSPSKTDIGKLVTEVQQTIDKGKPPEKLLHPELLKLQNVYVQVTSPKPHKTSRSEVAVVQNQDKEERKGKRKEKKKTEVVDETGYFVPQSPKLGPLEITDPRTTKSYYWCSCGLSSKQPLCDGMHFGTKFKPIKFRLAEKQEQIFLCGCKMTETAPFCDGKTCLHLKAEFESQETKVEQLQKETEVNDPAKIASKAETNI